MPNSLLPQNQTELESAIANASEFSISPDVIAHLWDVENCPASLLPWLAWALSVDDWDDAWDETARRNFIAASIDVHRKKGTAEAVRKALTGLGHEVNLIEWHQKLPVGDPYTFALQVNIEGAPGPSNEAEYDEIECIALSTKNVRSHLTGVNAKVSVPGQFFAGGVAICGETVTVGHPLVDFVEPTLDLDFVNQKYFVSAQKPSLQSFVTITGGENGTRRNEFGKIVPAAAPRVDYDPVTGKPVLLSEEQRNNRFINSENFAAGSWSKSGVTVTADVAVSPSGATNADLIEAIPGSTLNGIGRNITVPSSANSWFTLSVFVKAGTASHLRFMAATAAGPVYVWFNLATGAFETAEAGWSTAIPIDLGNGWRRIFATFTFTSADAGARLLSYAPVGDDGSNTLSGNVNLWGGMAEQGDFVTSYIPTTTTQITRTADEISLTAHNFSAWYRQDEGTFVIEASTDAPLGQVCVIAEISDGGIENSIAIAVNDNGGGLAFINIDDVEQISLSPTGVPLGQSGKIAFSFKQSEFALSVNGSVPVTASSGNLPTADRLYLGANDFGFLSGKIRRIRFYPRAMPGDVQGLSR